MDERSDVRTNVRTYTIMIAIIHASKLQSALPPGVFLPTDRLFICRADNHGRVIITGLSHYFLHRRSREVEQQRAPRAYAAKGPCQSTNE
jgi:hypothetical protein